MLNCFGRSIPSGIEKEVWSGVIFYLTFFENMHRDRRIQSGQKEGWWSKQDKTRWTFVMDGLLTGRH